MYAFSRLPQPPAPSNPEEAARWEHTRHRRALMEGTWQRLLEDRLQAQLGSTRRQAWGIPDLSANPFRVIAFELSTLFDAAPDVHHNAAEDAATRNGGTSSAEALIGGEGLIAKSGYWSQMPRIQAMTIALREMWVRIDVVDGRLTYRPVSPDMIIAEADPQRPTIPLAIAEIRLRHLDGETVWAWDVLDIRDPAFPRYEVRKADGTGGFGEDITVQVLGENDAKRNPADPEWSGANYPYRRVSNDAPILPGVLYHASNYGDRLFDPYYGLELFEGSISLSVFYTFLSHCLRDASFPQRYAIGVRVAGTEMTDGATRGARVEVVTDPTTILMLDAATESQPTVGQFQAGADVSTLESTISAIAHRLATDAGLSQTDIQRTSGSAKSGYAISLSNEGKRMAQRRYVVQFRASDEELVAKSAILFNRATGSSFPEGGYAVLYREIPLSPEELSARRTHALEMLDAGLMDRVEALRQFGNLTEQDAIAKLALIETMKAATSTGAATMTSEEQTPPPAATVTDSETEGAFDAVEELDAATAALQALASTTRDAASREVLRAVLDSLAEAKGYLTGAEIEAVTELPGEEVETETETETMGDACPIETQDIAVNLRNRQKAINVANYGPADPNNPGDYWQGKATRMRATVEDVANMKCANCAFFNVTTPIIRCIEQGIGADAAEVVAVGKFGLCEAFDFKCASSRTCDAWVVGGPIADAGTPKVETMPETVTTGAAPDESIAAAAAASGQPASAVALNGAQVQAAQGIITSVAKGELPRATGVEMLVQFFNMDPKAADTLMGTVGASFTPPAPTEG